VTAREASKALRKLGSPEAAEASARFFKQSYSAHDKFLGVAAPALRQVAKQFRELPPAEMEKLLQSPFNEERALALVLLGERYPREPDEVYELYMRNLGRVNNWNLVDASAPYILGQHVLTRSRKILDRLGRSKELWERRVAVVATQTLIRGGQFDDTLRLCAKLLEDPHDLMHKACGWMLREVGKRDEAVLEGFLEAHAARMPRTMLRYAIERFPPERRKAWLTGLAYAPARR
jgi:3-methyladenine DNA glycosylase AlkD